MTAPPDTDWPAAVLERARAGRRFAADQLLYRQLTDTSPALVLKSMARAVAADQDVLFTSLGRRWPGADPLVDAFLLVALSTATGGHPDRPRSLDLAARAAATAGPAHVAAILTALLDIAGDQQRGRR